ncbi:LAFA_0C08042g1_1 [Lachancea sp. 'fantastica']|nr:LAFA_0C08042g1_1 [Lachancea sp. 'fantastica']
MKNCNFPHHLTSIFLPNFSGCSSSPPCICPKVSQRRVSLPPSLAHTMRDVWHPLLQHRLISRTHLVLIHRHHCLVYRVTAIHLLVIPTHLHVLAVHRLITLAKKNSYYGTNGDFISSSNWDFFRQEFEYNHSAKVKYLFTPRSCRACNQNLPRKLGFYRSVSALIIVQISYRCV